MAGKRVWVRGGLLYSVVGLVLKRGRFPSCGPSNGYLLEQGLEKRQNICLRLLLLTWARNHSFLQLLAGIPTVLSMSEGRGPGRALWQARQNDAFVARLHVGSAVPS